MSLIYPNIVPDNNLRLPEALTVKHGPAPLLSRFVLEADKAARRAGMKMLLRHDFDELHWLNQHQVAAGTWFALIDMFDSQRTDISPENAFWISGENDAGEIIATFAARIYHWPDTNLAEQAVAMMYGRDDGQPCVITAEAAHIISGVVMSSGAAWVHPDYRGRRLSRLLPRTAKAYASARWPLDWTMGYVTPSLAAKGLANSSYGTSRLSASVNYPELPWGDLVIAFTAGPEVYDDLRGFLGAELSDDSGANVDPAASPTGRAQELMNISPDAVVFHGSNNRS
jgi:GNAT superfamily N-acetyltransferase